MVEVLIGSCVIIFLLAPALAVVNHGTKTMDKARMTVLTSAALQTQMEDFRTMNFDTLKANYLTGKVQPITLTPTITAENFTSAHAARLTMKGRFAEVSGCTDLIELTLSITWSDQGGHGYTRNYYSRFSKDGLSDKVLDGF